MNQTKEQNLTKSEPDVITGELIDSETVSLIETDLARSIEMRKDTQQTSQLSYLRYMFVPFIFLTVALFGGMRLSGVDGSFIFLKPALLCLVFASVLLVLFFRSGLIQLEGWFSESF